MTTPINLDLVWASSTDDNIKEALTDAKYTLGWTAEIPAFQNFNYILNALGGNTLSMAEQGLYPWQGKIGYKAGVRVIQASKVFTCIQDHNDSENSNIQSPIHDSENIYWVHGMLLGSSNPETLNNKDGLSIDEVNNRTINGWDSNDLTISNTSPLISLKTTNLLNKNWLLGNISGTMCLVDVGTTVSPDSRVIRVSSSSTHRIYHEGHKPNQNEVSGTIPDSRDNGKTYGRRNGRWVEVSSTTVKTGAPPALTGSGRGWFNLGDGRLYIDVNDGDSSQWVEASPPVLASTVATANASTVNQNIAELGTNVQEALEALNNRDSGSGGTNTPRTSNKNRIINGDKSVNQREYDSSFPLPNGEYGYDRWKGANNDADTEQVILRRNMKTGMYTISWIGGGTATVNGVSGLVSGSSLLVTVSGNVSVIVPKRAIDIQLEPGTVATEFEWMFHSDVVKLCRDYYRVVISLNDYWFLYNFSGTSNLAIEYSIEPEMVITPTATYEVPSGLTSVDVFTSKKLFRFRCYYAPGSVRMANLVLDAEL